MDFQSYAVFSEAFFKTTLIDKLKQLSAEQTPNWGIMTPQHMVEHLVGSWLISNGKFNAQQFVSKETRTKKLKFLFSQNEFDKNLNPTGQIVENKPLKKENLAAAIDSLKENINTFFIYHQTNPQAKPIHPVFGALTCQQWLLFQTKHTKHHLIQFGLW